MAQRKASVVAPGTFCYSPGVSGSNKHRKKLFRFVNDGWNGFSLPLLSMNECIQWSESTDYYYYFYYYYNKRAGVCVYVCTGHHNIKILGTYKWPCYWPTYQSLTLLNLQDFCRNFSYLFIAQHFPSI